MIILGIFLVFAIFAVAFLVMMPFILWFTFWTLDSIFGFSLVATVTYWQLVWLGLLAGIWRIVMFYPEKPKKQLIDS